MTVVSRRAPYFSLAEPHSETERAQEQAEVAKAFQEANAEAVSYTHLTLPTILLV